MSHKPTTSQTRTPPQPQPQKQPTIEVFVRLIQGFLRLFVARCPFCEEEECYYTDAEEG